MESSQTKGFVKCPDSMVAQLASDFADMARYSGNVVFVLIKIDSLTAENSEWGNPGNILKKSADGRRK